LGSPETGVDETTNFSSSFILKGLESISRVIFGWKNLKKFKKQKDHFLFFFVLDLFEMT